MPRAFSGTMLRRARRLQDFEFAPPPEVTKIIKSRDRRVKVFDKLLADFVKAGKFTPAQALAQRKKQRLRINEVFGIPENSPHS